MAEHLTCFPKSFLSAVTYLTTVLPRLSFLGFSAGTDIPEVINGQAQIVFKLPLLPDYRLDLMCQ